MEDITHSAIILGFLLFFAILVLSIMMILVNFYEYTHYRIVYRLLKDKGFEISHDVDREINYEDPEWDTVNVYTGDVIRNIITFNRTTKEVTIGEYMLSPLFPDLLDPIEQYWRLKYWIFFNTHIKPHL